MDLRVMLAAATFAATGCQSSPPMQPAGETLAYYQYAGSRQCERGGKTPDTLRQELSAAGVAAASVSCGADGRMYAQSCGMPDGRILVVRVPQAQASAAARLNLKPLRELPEAVAVACR